MKHRRLVRLVAFELEERRHERETLRLLRVARLLVRERLLVSPLDELADTAALRRALPHGRLTVAKVLRRERLRRLVADEVLRPDARFFLRPIVLVLANDKRRELVPINGDRELAHVNPHVDLSLLLPLREELPAPLPVMGEVAHIVEPLNASRAHVFFRFFLGWVSRLG